MHFSVFKAARDDDYWSEDFDNNKNCQQEEKLNKLTNEVCDRNKYSTMLFSGKLHGYLTIFQANEIRQADSTAPIQCLTQVVHKYIS